MMTGTEALIYTMEVYSQTNKAVSQEFYQALCDEAIEKLKSQAKHIKLLNQCDDSSTEVIAKMDVEIETRIARIKNLNVVIEHQKEVIERQGEHAMKRHNVLCGVKEVIDEYFGELR